MNRENKQGDWNTGDYREVGETNIKFTHLLRQQPQYFPFRSLLMGACDPSNPWSTLYLKPWLKKIRIAVVCCLNAWAHSIIVFNFLNSSRWKFPTRNCQGKWHYRYLKLFELSHDLVNESNGGSRSRPSHKERGRSSRPWDKGGPGLRKKIFRPFGSQFGLKITRVAGPPGPLPCICHWSRRDQPAAEAQNYCEGMKKTRKINFSPEFN